MDILGGLQTGLSLLTDFGNIGSNAYNAYQSSKMNAFNMGMAKEQWEWQKQQTEIDRGREDTAIQRRMADLQAAGLHPALASGQAAVSTGVQSPVAHELSPAQMGKFAVATNLMNLRQAQAGIEQTNAQTEWIRKQIEGFDPSQAAKIGLMGAQKGALESQKAKEDYFMDHVYPNMSARDQANIRRLRLEADELSYNLKMSQKQNVRTTDHDSWVQRLNFIREILTDLFSGKKVPAKTLENSSRRTSPSDSRGIPHQVPGSLPGKPYRYGRR